jgi:hypothetical protein
MDTIRTPPRRLVRMKITPRIAPEQKAWLEKQDNQDATIRQALWLLMATEARIEEEKNQSE